MTDVQPQLPDQPKVETSLESQSEQVENNSKPEKHKETTGKGHQKKQPYIRQVELRQEKLSPDELEAKMAAMALKNAQLIQQKKAADQDAAEYREIELKSQQALEAQRAQQREIDAVRKVAAERKLGKSQGREWDWEKADDWDRYRPYTDSMTNPNPGKSSWGAYRGSGYRGRAPRGAHPRARGRGRGRGTGRATNGNGKKVEEPEDQESVPLENEASDQSQSIDKNQGEPEHASSTSEQVPSTQAEN